MTLNDRIFGERVDPLKIRESLERLGYHITDLRPGYEIRRGLRGRYRARCWVILKRNGVNGVYYDRKYRVWLYPSENNPTFQYELAKEDAMSTPKEVQKYAGSYHDGAWRQYEAREFGEWAHLLLKRAVHRTQVEKRKKDLTDARNYALFLLARVDETARALGVTLEE